MLSRIWIGTRRRRRRGIFERYQSIENNDERDGPGSVAATYGELALKTRLECVELTTLQFSFSNVRFLDDGISEELEEKDDEFLARGETKRLYFIAGDFERWKDFCIDRGDDLPFGGLEKWSPNDDERARLDRLTMVCDDCCCQKVEHSGCSSDVERCSFAVVRGR